MATKRKKRSPKGKTYRFQLTLTGIAGISVVCFCLFFWMFLLGIWAGQTFLLPSARPDMADKYIQERKSSDTVKTLVSQAKKKPAAPAGK